MMGSCGSRASHAVSMRRASPSVRVRVRVGVRVRVRVRVGVALLAC